MKKILVIALAAVLAVSAMVVVAENNAKEENQLQTLEATENNLVEEVATEEEAAQVYSLSGAVTEVGEDYFIMQDSLLGEVQVNFGEESVFEGVEADKLEVGQIVFVIYNGAMTRSLPPQVFALRVNMFVVTGEITELSEESMTIVRDEIGDEVIVSLPEDAPELAVGDHVLIYSNGVMTMSLPARMNALSVVVTE